MGKRTLTKQQRIAKAKQWLSTYEGSKVLKGYKKKFVVDTLTALRELQELGVKFDTKYIEAVEHGEKHRLSQIQLQKLEKSLEHQDIEETYSELGIWEEFYDGEVDNKINIVNNHRVNFENRVGIIKKAGKNHVKVNGTLLQTNKKWSHLKQKQRDWIYELTRLEHKKFIEENNTLPMKTGKKKLITVIKTKIDERGIWLPSYELERGIGKYIDKLNRKTPPQV